jgi:Uma2 family endonuclease
MPKVLTAPPEIENFAELLEQLGDISPERIRLRPAPGTAKERHVVEINDRTNRLFELVDGVLVEKAMGALSSLLASALGHLLWSFVEKDDLGVVLGADGFTRLGPRLVRIPDVSFISWDRIPSGQFPKKPIPDIVPDLAVEVLSESNTAKEIARKLREYFAAGVRLAWVIDPESRTIDVYTSPRHFRRLRNGQTLDGGSVLPGFKLPLRSFFARTSRRSDKKE